MLRLLQRSLTAIGRGRQSVRLYQSAQFEQKPSPFFDSASASVLGNPFETPKTMIELQVGSE